MATKVLTATVLRRFFEDGKGAEEVESLLIQAERRSLKLLIAIPTLAEFYSEVARAADAQVADRVMDQIGETALELCQEKASAARVAGRLNAEHGVALGDGFAIALAAERKAELVSITAAHSILLKGLKVRIIGE